MESIKAGATRFSIISAAVWVFLAGLGIGWLAGLSVSPVVSAILATLMGLAGGLVAGMQALGKTPQSQAGTAADPRPVALLVLGIAMGAPLGITARTHDWFAEEGASLEFGASAAGGVLFNTDTEVCREVLSKSYVDEEDFRTAFRQDIAGGMPLDSVITDIETLRNVTIMICDSLRV